VSDLVRSAALAVSSGPVPLVIVTHYAATGKFRRALNRISALSTTAAPRCSSAWGLTGAIVKITLPRRILKVFCQRAAPNLLCYSGVYQRTPELAVGDDTSTERDVWADLQSERGDTL
jgi:hypothetical protein